MKRTFKSIFCLFLVFGLLTSLAACSEDISGHYTLVSATIGNQEYNLDQLKEMAGSTEKMFVELNSDGTGQMTMLGSSAELKWEGNQLWAVTGSTRATFTVEGNTLTLDLGNAIMVFQK